MSGSGPVVQDNPLHTHDHTPIARIDTRCCVDRYGNSRQRLEVHATVPLEPCAKGYVAAAAEAVLVAARRLKAANPDSEVVILSVDAIPSGQAAE